MSLSPIAPPVHPESAIAAARRELRTKRGAAAAPVVRFSAHNTDIDASQRHAELFYLQKQIQSQTPMVVILEDGEQIEGCIEWYDRNSIKIRGRSKTLVYKSSIKYMYKLGDVGQ